MQDREFALRHQENLFQHMNSMASLLEGLVEKSLVSELGPADGKLYMQICDTLSEHYQSLERAFSESNRPSSPDPDASSEKDAGPEGDRPTDTNA